MKITISLLFVLFVAGCGRLEQPATLSSTDDFRQLFVAQLRESGRVEDSGSGGGEAGNVVTKDFGYLLPAENFSPERLYSVADTALKKWGALDKYHTTGTGGGVNRFEMHYGSGHAHAFIDITAYPERDKTRVDFLVRLVQ